MSTLIRTITPNSDITADCVTHTTNCATPPLAAGTWTVEYADIEARVEAGATAQSLICVDPSGEPPVTETPL